MKKTVFMEKYPVYSLSLCKNELTQKNVQEIVDYFKEKIDNHPVAKYITTFDHYSHTKALNGKMVDGLLDAQNVIFCFGQAIPDTKILAVRPRSIGICEFEKKFEIDFIEAPKCELQELMEKWAKGLYIGDKEI